MTCDYDRTCLGRTAERFCLSSLRLMDSWYQRCRITAIPQFLFFSFHIQFAISGVNSTQTSEALNLFFYFFGILCGYEFLFYFKSLMLFNPRSKPQNLAICMQFMFSGCVGLGLWQSFTSLRNEVGRISRQLEEHVLLHFI